MHVRGLAGSANMERRALGDWGGDSTLQDSELGESALTGTDWQVKSGGLLLAAASLRHLLPLFATWVASLPPTRKPKP